MESTDEMSVDVLDADQAYVLMSNEYRISRNRRAEWFFAHLDSVVTVPKQKDLSQFSSELELISVVPKNPPRNWCPSLSHLFQYKIGSRTSINFLARKYRLVYCLDISSSVASVDVQAGLVMFEGIYGAIKSSMEGLVRPFYVPGSLSVFQPKIFVTVIAHAPFLASVPEQVLIQGVSLDPNTIDKVVKIVFERLTKIETRIAEVTASISEALENAQEKSDRIVGQIFDEDNGSSFDSAVAMSPDFGFVDLLRQALTGMHLLSENSTAGLIIVTDGVISVPDGGYLDAILSQLRYNTVSCSFMQLSSPFHPHLCYGVLPYADLMRFISCATFGAFLTSIPDIKDTTVNEMNIYHNAFLSWSFQKGLEGFKLHSTNPPNNKPGEWSVRNKCFFSVRDMPIVKKQQYETSLSVHYLKILSCRLREGFTIKEVNVGQDDLIEIKLTLPWKFNIQIEYVLIKSLTAQPKVSVWLEGPYDFVHDVTCLVKKPLESPYRQLMVTRFWSSQKSLSESDKLLVHFSLLPTNPAFYNIPDSLRNGVPLFYISSSNSAPVLMSSDFESAQSQLAQFINFWKPVCSLDTTIWQKWMHTHSVGIILEHDHPLPKGLHLPNTSGRYHVIQCRQSNMALNTLLKDWSSFVLVENHSYVKLMYNDNEIPPSSFYIIRVTSKPPCVVLRLAFLVGTSGRLRHQAVTELREKIADLTFPQRLNESHPEWRNVSPNPSAVEEQEAAPSKQSYKKGWTFACCTLLHKPIEKILIRYERVPRNLFQSLLPQNMYSNLTSPKSQLNKQSTFGFRPTFHTPSGSSIKMGPESFNIVARYLSHRRWIWCVHSSTSSPLSLPCASQILTTLTKMRLQEGFRFANSAAGTVNMVMELCMQTGDIDVVNKEPKGTTENEEDDESALTPCILQYVLFPPVTSLESNSDDEEEGEAESVEEQGELYLVTECWIEPQYGKVVSENEQQFLNGLEYSEVPQKIFEIDRECISAFVTFEHLSQMCKDEKVPSPTHIAAAESRNSRQSLTSENIKSIPFAFELNRILPKSQQAEILFSMFTQDLSVSFPVNPNDEFSNYCDRANHTLYEALIANVGKLHDREVLFADEEHLTILKIIFKRERMPGVYGLSFGEGCNWDQKGLHPSCIPRWRCFIKGIHQSHVIVTLLPASYSDLKLLMFSQGSTVSSSGEFSHTVKIVSGNDNEEKEVEEISTLVSERSFAELSEQADGGPLTSTSLKDDSQEEDRTQRNSNSDHHSAILAGRKRSRAKSGGESGSLAKEPLNQRNSADSAFRYRAGSMDNYSKLKLTTRSRTKSADEKNFSNLDLTGSIYNDKISVDIASAPCVSNAPKTERDFIPKDHKPKYGSVSLPVFSYDCSLKQLIEHVVGSSSSGRNDLYVDCRQDSANNVEWNNKDEETSQVPPEENKSETVEKPKNIVLFDSKTDAEALSSKFLRKHCQALEIVWTKSYVHGLFQSLQNGFFIHHSDINIAMRMCQGFQIDVDLNEFITIVCGHFKDATQSKETEEIENQNSESGSTLNGSRSYQDPSLCKDVASVHSFIRKRFQNILLTTFNWVSDYSNIFYFNLLSENRLDIKRSITERADRKDNIGTVRAKNSMTSIDDSSKNTSDFEEVESLTCKADSACSEAFLRAPSKEDMSKSPDLGSEPLLPQEFFGQTVDEGSEGETENASPVPLFMYLNCGFKYQDYNGCFQIRDIPTCADEILGEIEDIISPEQDIVDLNQLAMSIQFVFLTVPPEIEEMEKKIAFSIGSRTFSMCSGSSLPTPKEEASPVVITENVITEPEKLRKKYPSLPPYQLLAVKKTVEDIKWLLKDEITSFRWDSDPLTNEVLDMVASHVQKSVGKQGCQLCIMPLTFVNNSYPVGFEKFKERFRNLSVEGFRLKEEGSWFYLVCSSNKSLVRKEKFAEYSKEENAGGKSHCIGSSELSKQYITEELLRATLNKQASAAVDNDMADAEIAEISDKSKELISCRSGRKFSGNDGNLNTGSKAGSMENVACESSTKNESEQHIGHRLFLTTPSQMSEISSMVGSVITNEEGYDGDGSDSGGEDANQHDSESKRPRLPPFWMLFKINVEQMLIYFQCRFNEDDLSMFEYSNKLKEKILGISMRLRRIVNQDILLQQLHDTRQCSPLLEPENDDVDLWEGREASSLPLSSAHVQNSEDNDYDMISQIAESTMDFAPGTFSCDIVWETKFFLHSRLRTGPGKSLLSRGIQTLQTTLIAFEVLNRKNMFVYRDISGNVFYLRLYRMHEPSVSASPNFSDNLRSDSQSETRSKQDYEDVQDSRFGFLNYRDTSSLDIHGTRPYSEDVVLLQVHGITQAGPEIKEQLVQSLRNKLDDSVLDILSVTLDRNPHCKLTPEDVHFIQKPFSSPDIILKYDVNTYAAQYLPAFSYYLYQNLLQFLHVPKYTDNKSENHFQDYSRYEDGSDYNDRCIYIYNQSPGGTGSRGIACLTVTLIDSLDNVVSVADSCRPSADAYMSPYDAEAFRRIASAEEALADSFSSEVVLELRVWKQGRINVDLLKTYFATAIKHCMWDLVVEFYFLTAPLSISVPKSEAVSASEPTTPMVEQNSKAEQSKEGMSQLKSPMVSLSALKANTGSTAISSAVDSSKEFMRSLERRNSANLPSYLPDTSDADALRPRSMSFSARKPAPTFDTRQLGGGRAASPLTLSQSQTSVLPSKSKFQIDHVTAGLSRLESGDCGALHSLYSSSFKQWCDVGSNLVVPSLRTQSISVNCRSDLEIVSQEVEKIIQVVAPDNVSRQYWNMHTRTNDGFMAGTLKSNLTEKMEEFQKTETELRTFKRGLKRLKEFEKLDETEYPADLLELFKASEEFNPGFSGYECLIAARNLIHWKSCITNGVIVDAVCIPEVPKNNYKFVPLMAGSMETNLFGGSPSSSSLEKMSRVSSTNGLASLSSDADIINNPLLIPRQRFLMVFVNNSGISFMFYNWSKESSDRLVEQTKCLALWLNARASLLSSVLAQKCGLFSNQSILNSMPSGLYTEGNPFTGGAVDVEILIKNPAPPKDHSTGRLATLKKAKSPKALASFLECYRNIKHASMLKIPEGINLLKAQGDQLLQNKVMEKKGPSASNIVGIEGIESFKQAARIVHYCMTPIIFLPRWRMEVAATRDSAMGTLKKVRVPPENKKLQFTGKADTRSRHNSGTSQTSLESAKTRNRSIWGLWGSSSNSINYETPSSQMGVAGAAKKVDEKWHATLCESFIQEYMQYLHSLGFIFSTKSNGRKRIPSKKDSESDRGRLGSVSTSFSTTGTYSHGLASFGNYVRRAKEEGTEKDVHYLHKNLPGGRFLFEVGLADPFFYSKLYALEATRMQKRKTRKATTYQNILAFLDECDKIKISMHLHSFTYDFHLRSIHSYLSGRQLIFKQGYHLTNFLDDFIKYYPKGPNFARNTVRVGMVTVQNVSTPSHILYNYILNHEKQYNMRVIRMSLQHPESNETANEYVLTQLSSKKVSYKDEEDESQCDEFDLTLLVAHDTPPFVRVYSVDPSVLRLKYYIVLTSRRELYPKLVEESRQGKLCIVNTPEALTKPKVNPNGKIDSKPESRRPSLSDLSNFGASESQLPQSISSEKDVQPDTRPRKPSTDKNVFEGIREEQVNYMGYFSSHEQMMQSIVNEQVVEIEREINEIVSKASIDCRRDLLWQRLLVGGQIDEKSTKNKKEDLTSRETVGALSYWEFSEMLELVQVKSLSEMDSRLTSLLRQPITFYESLLRLLMIKNEQYYRYFVAPDKSTRQMAIFSPNVQQSVVMLDINIDKRTADLSVVFKEYDERQDLRKTVELQGDILNLIESVVNACCYCCWTTLV